ncbi:MAG: glycosyltransferase family 39 protein [Myxococcota bacterium]
MHPSPPGPLSWLWRSHDPPAVNPPPLHPSELHTAVLWWSALVIARAGLALVWIPASGAGLGDTEAYYTAWSFDIMYGYHDHPGAIAWLIAMARWVLGSAWATRAVPVAAQAIVLAFMMGTWHRCTTHNSGMLYGAAVFMAIPIYGTGGLLAAPDAPLAAAWAGALWAMVRASTWRGWLMVGFCAAVAVLAKLFGLVLAVALGVEAWRSSPHLKERCARLGAVWGPAALGVLPTVWFEATHGWTGLRYHLLERHTDAWFDLNHGLGMLGAHLLVLSPVLGLLLVGALCPTDEAETPEGRARAQARRVAWWTLVPLGLAMVLTRESEPHWAALAWLPLIGPMVERARRSRWLPLGVVLGAVLQGLLWLHVMTPWGVALIPAEHYTPRYDLSNDLWGWDQVAERAQRMLQAGDIDRVAGYHYTVCGQLVAGLDDLASVVCISRRRDAFDALLGGRAGTGRPGERLLYVRDNRYDELGPQRLRCDTWGKEERIVVMRGARVGHTFGLRVCDGFRGMVPGPP